MKKTSFCKSFCLALAAILVIIPSIVALSACKKTSAGDTMFVNIEKNSASASWTGSWQKRYGTGDTSLLINRYDYTTWVKKLPLASDMSAPSGKVFAGWYFDQNCTSGNEYNLLNWTKRAIKNAQPTSLYAYAKWIDEGQVNVILNLDNYEAKFVDGGTLSTNWIVDRDQIDTIYDNLPTANSVNLNNSTLVGWSTQCGYTITGDKTAVTQENISSTLENQSYIYLYAIWEYQTDLIALNYEVSSPSGTTATLLADHYPTFGAKYSYYLSPYSPCETNWSLKNDYGISCCFFANDTIDKMKAYSPTMNDIKVVNSRGKDVSSKYKIVGYKISYGTDTENWTESSISSLLEEQDYGIQGFTICIIVGKK